MKYREKRERKEPREKKERKPREKLVFKRKEVQPNLTPGVEASNETPVATGEPEQSTPTQVEEDNEFEETE